MKVIVICFANTCRSPVAETLLATSVGRHSGVTVTSKGTEGGPGLTPPAMQQALDEAGITLQSPSGETLERDDARSADLLLFMERALLREAVVRDTSLWPKSFTLREFARRANLNPPSPADETFEQWIALLHGTRSRNDLLGADAQDDILDPGLSGDVADYREMIATLRSETLRVAPMLTGWPSTSE